MITKYMTEITTRFNPFTMQARPARLFLSFLPPNARQSGLTINTVLLPRTSKEAPSLFVKFSAWPEILLAPRRQECLTPASAHRGARDGEKRTRCANVVLLQRMARR